MASPATSTSETRRAPSTSTKLPTASRTTGLSTLVSTLKLRPETCRKPPLSVGRAMTAISRASMNLLAGGLNDAELVAEGVDVDDVLVGDVAGGDVGADAAAVHEADVGVADDAVGVGAEVADVGLLGADEAGAVLGVAGEGDGALRDDGR